ncbi:claudin-4-like [Betta splendens]|uniref:Claudin n=1 Tax=Betta splendens TaxID=158456 RepID=A0A6P7PKC1_BETSP|nr:claudin-4-like [Betta splendens]
MWTQVGGFVVAVIGFLGTILICALPMWIMSAFVGANIVTAQVTYQGLWMNCVIESTGVSQCQPYYSVLALPQQLQVSRALICVSIGVAALAVGFTSVGVRCNSLLSYDPRAKARYGIAGGAVFVLAGVLCLVPVSWSAYSTITGFYSSTTTSGPQGELGASIYLGWVSGALLVIGGVMLCCTYRC